MKQADRLAKIQKIQAEERARDIDRIKRVADWPRWPRLPMKRGPQNEELACLMANNVDGGFELYHTSLFDQITGKTPSTHFASAEEVVHAGWRVD